MDKLKPKIIFEDDNILVVDKPFGMIVNCADTSKDEDTLEDWVEGNYHITADRHGIVHRLDKDTSGVIVVAKNTDAQLELQRQFKERLVQKKYLALVHGEVKPRQGVINVPIERNPFNRMRFGVFPGGKDAITEYTTLKNYKNYTLLEVSPHTGRTHQIRVHLKHIGYCIVSDILYSGRKNLKEDQKIFSRMFLHAKSLEFNHPVSGERIKIETPLPSELKDVLNKLCPI